MDTKEKETHDFQARTLPFLFSFFFLSLILLGSSLLLTKLDTKKKWKKEPSSYFLPRWTKTNAQALFFCRLKKPTTQECQLPFLFTLSATNLPPKLSFFSLFFKQIANQHQRKKNFSCQTLFF